MTESCQVCGGGDFRDYVVREDGHFRQCRGCGLIVNARSEEAVTEAQGVYDGPELMLRPDRRFNHKVRTARGRLDLIAGYQPTGRLLDVGCGNCAMLVAARAAGYEAIGVDVGAYPVQRGRELGLEVQHGTLAGTGFADESFDVVTLWSVLEHMPRSADGLAEVYRILKPGGVMGLMVPNGEYLRAELFRGTHRYYGRLGRQLHFVYHNPRTIRRTVKDAGFELLPAHGLRRGAFRRGVLPTAAEVVAVPVRTVFNLLRDAARWRQDIVLYAQKPTGAGREPS